MAAGSSSPPVASEKTSEGCRTTAANASPSSGALSPSTMSTRRRSPRAGPSVISLSPTADRLEAEEARAAEQDVVAARPHVPHLDGTVEGRGRGLEAQHVRDQAARPRQLEDR